MQIINIPLEIPEQLINAGAIELYASKFARWTPTIKELNEEQVEVEIENPVSAYEACVGYIREFVKEGYRAILAEQGAEQGRKQAIETFDAFFKAGENTPE